MNTASARQACKEIIDKTELLKAGKLSKEERKSAFASMENSLSLIERELGLSAAPMPQGIVQAVEQKKESVQIAPSPVKTKHGKADKFKPSLSAAQKSRYLREVNVSRDTLRDFVVKKKKIFSLLKKLLTRSIAQMPTASMQTGCLKALPWLLLTGSKMSFRAFTSH